ncbi:MAG: adenylate/guanylate cyclase domain-containing protein [Sulfurimonadaceae bacterium]|jgi:adenylate cyclase|nr:adenylate/guanylate cyclase domain-containing protein [Sulfurimonadaceae bacterium]
MSKTIFKKVANYLLVAFLVSSFFSGIYIFFPNLLSSFDDRIKDSFFTHRGAIEPKHKIVIVDIDEPSLERFSQWPWSRDIVAKILENLTKSKVAIIGLDMVFAEDDRTSPSLLAKKLNLDMELENYDEILAKTLSQTPTILGYSFDFNQKNTLKTPSIPAVFVEKNKEDGYILEAPSVRLNIDILQDSAYSSGFFNILPNQDGIIRLAPLLISMDDMLYPSLSLEMIRALYGASRVYVNYGKNGVENITLDELSIPTDSYGRLLINYRGDEKSFTYVSAKDIYDKPDESLEDAIVLVGTSAIGLLDLRATPFSEVFAGVEIHANIIDNILSGDFIQKPPYGDGLNIFSIFVSSFFVVLVIAFVPLLLKITLFLLILGAFIALNYKLFFEYGISLNTIFILLSMVLSFVLSVIVEFFYSLKQQRAIKAKFASKVSKNVMDEILKNLDENKLSVANKEVSIFFSDIRGFSSISEKLTPKELIAYLNRYMSPMSEIIIKHQGTIDKFIGDAIMAYWNAPLDVKNHADLALQAALEQLKYLDVLNEQFAKDNLPHLDIGIGINSGEVIVGEMGSDSRSDYTVIGDAINIGSRTESLCKYYNSRLNITNYTKEKLKGDYTFRFLDLVMLKGKNEPVEIWQVLEPSGVSKSVLAELEAHHKAIEYYKDSNFKEALAIFEKLQADEHKTNQNIYIIYIDRCKEFIKNPPENFNGVYEHTTKS